MKRAFQEKPPASTDVPEQATPELERLADSASLSSHFGSRRLVGKFLAAWFQPGATYRVLSLFGGSGDVPRFIADWCEKHGVNVRIDALDSSQAILDLAKAQSASYRNIQWLRGNALTYEPGSTYDMVYCSLAPRCFNDQDMVKLLRRSRELSHQFVVVAGLERSVATWLGVGFLNAFVVREPAVRDFGRLCAEKAFSWGEMRDLAKAAGWENFGQARFLPFSQAVWLFKRELSAIPALSFRMPNTMPCPT